MDHILVNWFLIMGLSIILIYWFLWLCAKSREVSSGERDLSSEVQQVILLLLGFLEVARNEVNCITSCGRWMRQAKSIKIAEDFVIDSLLAFCRRLVLSIILLIILVIVHL